MKEYRMENEGKFKIVDLFCGMSNFRAGFERAGAECVYSVEFDKHKRKIVSVIYGEEPEANNIMDVHGRDIPDSDCWCFGFPCVNASIAGNRSGLDGEGTGLFFEVMRLLDERKEEDRPKYLLAENVRHLLSVNRGFDFKRVLTELDNRGYDVQWQVIDSKYFVPQHRERIYICGYLRAKCKGSREILPIPIPVVENEIPVRQIMEAESNRNNPNQYRVYDISGLAPTITKSEGGGREPHVAITICDGGKRQRKIIVLGSTRPHRHSTSDVHCINGLMSTMCQRDYKEPKLIAVPVGEKEGGR